MRYLLYEYSILYSRLNICFFTARLGLPHQYGSDRSPDPYDLILFRAYRGTSQLPSIPCGTSARGHSEHNGGPTPKPP